MSTSRIFKAVLPNVQAVIKIASEYPNAIRQVRDAINGTCAWLSYSDTPCENATLLAERNITCALQADAHITVSECSASNLTHMVSYLLQQFSNLQECAQLGIDQYVKSYDDDCFIWRWGPTLAYAATIFAASSAIAGYVIASKCKEHHELTERANLLAAYDNDDFRPRRKGCC